MPEPELPLETPAPVPVPRRTRDHCECEFCGCTLDADGRVIRRGDPARRMLDLEDQLAKAKEKATELQRALDDARAQLAPTDDRRHPFQVFR